MTAAFTQLPRFVLDRFAAIEHDELIELIGSMSGAVLTDMQDLGGVPWRGMVPMAGALLHLQMIGFLENELKRRRH